MDISIITPETNSLAVSGTPAETQLARIRVSSVTISVPTGDPMAQQEAVVQVIAAAQAQVLPGYIVTFTPTGYDPVNGTLTGSFTVTDTASDSVDKSITVTASASVILDGISVPSVTIDVPLDDISAQSEAVIKAIEAAKAQTSPGYTVTFVTSGYDPASATLTGSFIVINISNPADVAIDSAQRSISVNSAVIPTTSELELAKLSVTTVTIKKLLNDVTAQQAAIDQALAAAQAQVAPGYNVMFAATGYSPYTGTLTGFFIVADSNDPSDMAIDYVPRQIIVISGITSVLELAKINVYTVTIDIPLDDASAMSEAINQAVAAAWALISPGYTVTFIPVSYDPSAGILEGYFSVTNSTDATDTAAETSTRQIYVVSTFVPDMSASELAKIIVNTVTIDVPLDDPTAMQMAVDQSVAAAQLLISPGFTVTFISSSYSSATGILEGLFSVINDTDITDTATDISNRQIIVIYAENS